MTARANVDGQPIRSADHRAKGRLVVSRGEQHQDPAGRRRIHPQPDQGIGVLVAIALDNFDVGAHRGQVVAPGLSSVGHIFILPGPKWANAEHWSGNPGGARV